MSEIHVEELLKARIIINSRCSNHICYALGENKACDQIRHFINDSIYPNTTVRGWLEKNYPELRLHEDIKLMRKYRLAWIDQMIGIVRDW